MNCVCGHVFSGVVDYHVIEGEGVEEGLALSQLSERPSSGTHVERTCKIQDNECVIVQ